MSKGFCILAQNNSTTNYVKQAYALALSIHKFNSEQKITLITNDYVENKYKKIFDKILEIPWDDDSKGEDWKINNRWKIYHISPYEETIVMDADMLVLENIEHWWNYLEKRDLFFVSEVKTYRGETVTSNYYRKMFTANELPNLYSGIHYFKRSDDNKTFFVLLELIVKNYEKFYEWYAPNSRQDFCSIDVSAALACKILGNQGYITEKNSFVTFTHMKPNIQNWTKTKSNWTDNIAYDFENTGKLYVGNFLQKGVFHYVKNDFLNNEILETLENL
jgi:hypothetical protein